mmetsp:Transcript_31117/g.89981  ORF Transcript_31117/g.89981 Transcript_31117/m.89981 type:complete len:321 (+) Transcript_31117:386-1348(+)
MFVILTFALDDLSRLGLDNDVPAIQMLESIRKSTKSLVQRNILHQKQIGTLSLEHVVFLFLDDEMDVPRFTAWHFVSHTTESNLLVVVSTLFNVNLDNLALVLGLGGISLSLASAACSLHLSEHARAYLTNFHNHTLSVTRGTFFGVPNNDLSVNGKLDSLAIVKVLQRDLDRMLNARALSGSGSSSTTTATEEHAKQIFTTSRIRSSILLDTLKTVLIVELTFLGVTQNFVGGIDLLEKVFVSSLIWMVLDGQFAVSLFDFFLIGILVHAQDFIKLFRIRWLSAATAHSTHAPWHAAGKVLKWNSSKHFQKILVFKRSC